MRLKRLFLQGFKSFADKTELYFESDGIAGIVGPNGCGKSNTVDAIRWVMGEQSAKGLRGNEMLDVVFGGTSDRKASGFAEVSLTFDNADKLAPEPYVDHAEIMITRRLYRSGESEYLINNVMARLKDITDLFLGTGSSAKAYSIVQQGKIDEIVLAKPEERRVLIEEAAGVAKYKARKVSAERRMDATKLNLDRVEDILKELERNTKSLERQVERAEKYRSLQKELRLLDEQVFAAKATQLDRLATENNDQLAKAKETLAKASTSLSEVEGEIEKHRFEVLHQEKVTSSDYERLMQAKDRCAQLEKETELAEQKIQLLSNQIEERKKDVERIQEKWTSQSAEMKELLSDLEGLKTQKIEREEALRELRTNKEDFEKRVATQNDQVNRLKSQVDERRKEEARTAQRQEIYRKQRIDLEFRRAELERYTEEASVELHRLTLEHQEQAALFGDLASSIQQLESSQEAKTQSLEAKRARMAELHREKEEAFRILSQIEVELQSLKKLEEHQTGFSKSALQHKEASGDSFLLDQVTFKAEFLKAGEGFIAEVGQTFCQEDLSDKTEKVRWTRFYALTEHTFERSLFDAVEGEIDFELQKVLRAVELVDELPQKPSVQAQVDLQGRCRFPVGLGVFLESRGDVLREESPHLRRRDAEVLETKVVDQKKVIESLIEAQECLQRETIALSEEISQLQGRLRDCQIRRSELQESKLSLEGEKKTLLSKKEQWSADIKSIDIKVSEIENHLQPIEGSEDPEKSLERRYQEEVEALQGIEVQKEEADQAWIEKRIEFGAFQERLERIQDQTASAEMTQSEFEHNRGLYQTDIEEWTTQINELKEKLETLRRDRAEELGKIEAVEKGLADARDTLIRSRSEVEQREVDRKTSQSTKDQAQEKVSALELERQELRHQVEELDQLLSERYQTSLREVLQNVAEADLDRLEDETVRGAIEIESQELREKLNSFGEVNLLALQEYEEVKQRFDLMVSQKEDLLKTLDSLQSIIDRINKITEFRFRETFKAINHNFQILFPKLFGGGRAYMKLTDETNLLETGVEIFAEPPGKKIQVMSLLSGGEKAMTGISVLFSLFSYRPSSFCILDEVDAPLDEANTARYNEIVQEMSDLSQFIVITHNKRTMEIVDKLFGVTMQEPGVSRLVSVALNEAQAFVAQEPQIRNSSPQVMA